MGSLTPTTSLNEAELVEERTLFTTYLRTYLITKGIDAAFVVAEITAETIRDGFAVSGDTVLDPVEAQPRSHEERQSDEVITEHLQRYLELEGVPMAIYRQATGPHVVDAVLSSLPQHVLKKYHDDQAAQSESTPVRRKRSERRNSMTNPTTRRKRARADDDDEFEDMPTKHSRTSKSKYAKVLSGRPVTRRVEVQTDSANKIDLSQSDFTSSTSYLADLTMSEDGTFNTNISSDRYDEFLKVSAFFLAARFASVCVTLAGAGEVQKATDFGQFGLDLLGPALFKAHLVFYEGSEEEENSMLYSRMALVDCIDDIHNHWSQPLATRLRNLVIEHDMWWTAGQQ